jgi:hypothetical protein
MTTGTPKYTKRQYEVLACIYLRKHVYNKAEFIDLIGDLGISSNTLADHLDSLASKGLVPPSPYKKRKTEKNGLEKYKVETPTYRYKNHHGKIELTPLGETTILNVMNDLKISPNESRISALSKIKEINQTTKSYHGLRSERKSDFSKAFNELIIKDPTEPVISSVGMYTELDNQLGRLMIENPELYLQLSKTKLNLPIRNGRIASLVIPLALRHQMKTKEITSNLENGWNWFGSVNKNTIDRYVDESSSMGLIEVDSGSIKSCKPGTSSTIEWLASKTTSTFLNAVPNIPKAAILTFRESFAYPTIEDLLNPHDSVTDLEWSEYIYDSMSDKNIYRDIIKDTLNVMINQSNVMAVDPESGCIIPRTILRRLNEAPDLQEAFKRLLALANEKNPTASLLLMATAHPGITEDELYRRITKEKGISTTEMEFKDAIRQLVGKGLIHTAAGSETKLYAFTQIPYIVQTGSKQKNEINAVLKGISPSLLAKIEEIMNTDEDKTALQRILENLIRYKEVQFDSIETEYGGKYGKELSRKFMRLSEHLDPFVVFEKDASGVRVAKEELSSIVLDVSRYSVLTGKNALSEYSTLFSDLIMKDTNFKNSVIQSAQLVEDTFFDRGMNM